MPDLTRRVERLERQNVRLKATLGVFLAAVVSVAAVGQDVFPLPLRTNEVIIEDTNSDTRAVLGLADGAPVLRFYDADGRARVVLSVTPDGPTLLVIDEHGNPRDVFSQDASVVPLVRR